MAAGPSTLAFLAAPFQELRLLHQAGDQPPLAAMLVASGPDPLRSLIDLAGAVLRWPWLVPCIVVPPGTVALAPVVDLLPPFRKRLIERRHAAAVPPAPAVLYRELTRRLAPDADTMAGYVVHRIGAAQLKQHLAVEFAMGTGGNANSRPSRATESRLFRQYGAFTAADWRKIADLAVRAAGTAPGDAETPDPRTLQARARRYTGRSWREVRELRAWEWVLESALRFGRYPSGSGT